MENLPIGQLVTGAYVDNDVLILEFGDAMRLRVWDDGQSCCEHRYMMTDDDPGVLIGGQLLSIEVKPGSSVDSTDDWWGEVHETEFVEVSTTKGSITLVTHNEHNGFYGGFCLRAEQEVAGCKNS